MDVMNSYADDIDTTENQNINLDWVLTTNSIITLLNSAKYLLFPLVVVIMEIIGLMVSMFSDCWIIQLIICLF